MPDPHEPAAKLSFCRPEFAKADTHDMHASRHGDYGPLIFGTLVCLAALVPLFDVRGFSRYMARRVVERSRIHRMLGEQFGYWTIRAAGVSGLLVGSCLVLFT